jgi:hypothetical protein
MAVDDVPGALEVPSVKGGTLARGLPAPTLVLGRKPCAQMSPAPQANTAKAAQAPTVFFHEGMVTKQDEWCNGIMVMKFPYS